MKNKYIVKFYYKSGKMLYIKHLQPYCVTLDCNKSYIFTNKKTASEMAKYFIKYILLEVATYEIIKIN